MTLVTNAFTTFSSVGKREDLSDMIFNVAPDDTPFVSAIGKEKVTATRTDWQTDTLAAPAVNAQLQGDTITPAAITATVLRSNYTQISYKTYAVTGTQEAVDSAGRSSEWEYQTVKHAKELKLDMERSLLDNNAAVAGNSTTVPELSGVPAWIKTNTAKASDATAPTGDGSDAWTAGTARALAESQLQEVLRECFDSGGDPDRIFLSGRHKQAFSAFTGNATRMVNAQDRELVTAIDIYRSDFGDLQVIPCRNMDIIGSGDTVDHILVLQTDMWAMGSLRPMFSDRLAKTGDAERGYVLAEYTLIARNEKASGIITDLS